MDTQTEQKTAGKNKVKEHFFITDYMWYIFEIKKKQNQMNVRVAFNMFITNLEMDTERYKGAKGLKYKKARNLWRAQTEKDKKFQKF